MTRRPLIAGILSIVSGGFGVLISIGLIYVLISIIGVSIPPADEFEVFMTVIYSFFCIFFFILGALAIVGHFRHKEKTLACSACGFNSKFHARTTMRYRSNSFNCDSQKRVLCLDTMTIKDFEVAANPFK